VTAPGTALVRSSRARPALLAAGLVLASAAPADAWLQATTREEPRRPLHVAGSSCSQYTVLDSCSADVPHDACFAAVEAAMATWSVPGSYFRFEETRPAFCCRAGFQRDGANANCIMWREDEWPAEYPPAGIALTTLTYSVADGAILDADIELNAVDFSYGTTCAAGETDIQNTVTHEAGHMLGLDHSAVPGATMRPRSYPGDCELRDLSADDVEGVLAIYPAAADPATCRGPSGGLNLDCSPPPDDCGCRATGAGRPSAVAVLLFVLALLLRRRRDR
jgi:MYXO-CTERM domain-containing protein